MVFSMAWEFGHQLPKGGTCPFESMLLPASTAVQVVSSVQGKCSTQQEDEVSGGLFGLSAPSKIPDIVKSIRNTKNLSKTACEELLLQKRLE